MLRLQQFLAWYLGLKAPVPGEGTAWRLDWRVPGPAWLIAVGCLAWLIVWTVLIIAASQGKKIKLPVLGKFAEQQANR